MPSRSTKTSRKESSVRLSPAVLPEHYELTFQPDLAKFSFSGKAVITIGLKKSVREITLHAKELKIQSAAILNLAAITANKITFNEKADAVTLGFPTVLKKGRIKLELGFTGILNDQMRGFYRSRYMVDGKEHYMATTQFEATDARRAFPCFDEPDKKATFQVTLIVPKGLTAISNTLPEKVSSFVAASSDRNKNKGGLMIHRFAPTPKMSTYLLAFIVGKFEYLETKTKEGVLVRVFAIPGKKAQVKFALDTASKMLSFFNNYFAIPYPLNIMQLIAIPDFSAGAMENWGAITYREAALLVDEKNSSAMNKQRVAIVIAHELAHQWFGDLVTMEWWTHLWLNEGFASYIEYLAVNEYFPEWDIWTQFVQDDMAGAFRLDALKNTHPIEVEVRDPKEIDEIFDTVSYSKGATVIRMLAAYLGAEQFRDGLRYYLKKHKYANARTEDLWAALASVSKKPVAKIMKNWTGKPGYPLITLDESKNKSSVTARQRRFFSSAALMKTERDTTLWQVPLGLPQPGGTLLLSGKSMPLKNIEPGTKLNQGETTLMRVQYPPSWLMLLEKQVFEKKLAPPDRLGIIRDAFALAEAGVTSVTEALRLVRSYKNEHDYTVWSSLAGNVGQIGNLVFGTPEHDAYENFARSIFAEIARKMGWEKHPNESHTDIMLRNLAIMSFGAYGDRDTIRTAQQRFAELLKQGKEIHPDIRGVVYALVGEYGNASDQQALIKLYRAADSQQEKSRLAGALGSFKNPELLKKTLAFAFSNNVRAQDTPGVVATVGSNPYGRDSMWEFVQSNWPAILKRYGNGGHMLPAFIWPLSGFHDGTRAKEVAQFFKTHAAPGAERTVQQVLERIRSNAEWLKRDQKNIAAFLENYEPMQ